MCTWLELGPLHTEQEPDLIEFFSGSGRVSRLAHARGYHAVAIDTLYDTSAPPPRTPKRKLKEYRNARSCMDLNSSAGFLLLDLEMVQHASFEEQLCRGN